MAAVLTGFEHTGDVHLISDRGVAGLQAQCHTCGWMGEMLPVAVPDRMALEYIDAEMDADADLEQHFEDTEGRI